MWGAWVRVLSNWGKWVRVLRVTGIGGSGSG